MGRQIGSVQVLRGLAALAVVVFHFAEGAGGSWRVGAAGVDVFFIISGFVMWMIAAKPLRPGTFLRDRAVRIVPLYWLATLVLFAKNHPSLHDLGLSLLFVPFTSDSGGPSPVLQPGWTLNVEMFFYVLFFLSLTVPKAMRLAALSTALGGLALAGLVFHPEGPVLQAYTNPRLLEFMLGIWLCVVWQAARLPGPRISAAMVVGGLAAFAVGEAVNLVDMVGAVPAWGLPSLLIVGGLLGLEGLTVKWPCALSGLGDASYSLYLFHGIVLSVMLKFMATDAWVFVAGVPASLVSALLVYRFIEKPMLRWMRGKAKVTRPNPALRPAN